VAALQPYRVSACATRTRDVVPNIVTIGLSVAAWGFAIAAFMWLVAHAVTLLDRSHRASALVEVLYAWTVDAAIALAAALCAWRPVPGTRSHVFARLAVVGWLVAVVAEQWPSHTVIHYDRCGQVLDQAGDAAWLLIASSLGRLLMFLSLAGLVLAAGRRFALPRWMPVVAAGLGATLSEVGLDEVLLGHRGGSSLTRYPMYTKALAELLMLVAFTVAFAMAAFAVRRRPFLDEDAVLSTAPARTPVSAFDPRPFDYWRASISALLACTFALASRAGEELGFVPSLAGWESSRSIGAALGVVAFFVFVEHAHRQHTEISSWALTMASGFAALCGAASVFAVIGARPLLFREMGLVTTAMTLGGVALLLPNIPVVANVVTKVKGLLSAGAFFLLLSAGIGLSHAGPRASAPGTAGPWINGETVLLFAAVFFVIFAVHRARSIEREALIAEALATEHAARAGDVTT
jgi:hypothetical protein